MFIKRYTQFVKENKEEMSKGEILEFQLRDFNTKKNNLRNLVISNADTDKDISKNYEDIVGENPFLQHLGNLLKIEAQIIKKENKLKDMDETMDKLEGDKVLVDKMSDETEKEKQMNNVKDQIDKKQEEIKEDEKSVKELKERHKQMEQDLKDMVKQRTEELKEIEESPFIEND